MDGIQDFRFQDLIVPISVISLVKKKFTKNASGTNGWSDAASYVSGNARL
jgi:hypothetical protein